MKQQRWRTFTGKMLAPFLGLLLLMQGCGLYSFTGASTGGLKSIAIPTFENQTAEFGLAETISDDLIDRFNQDGSLKVRDARTADSILYGTIARITDQPAAFTAEGNVEQYKVTIAVHLRFEDRVKGKIVWEDTISQFGLYPFSGGSTADREQGLTDAMDKLVDDILSKTVSGW
ncbi:MAG: LptE family protein [bacterium]